MEYTFSSCIEDGFSVIHAPINYLGASKQLKWYVSCVNGKANTVLLDTDDYAIINSEIYFVNKVHVSLDDCVNEINHFINKANIFVEMDNSSRFILRSAEPFEITYMTPRLKYAFGLYYLKEVKIKSSQVDNDKYPYEYRCMATHFEYLTPVWYVVSNMGTPVQVSSLTDRFNTYYPAINVRIVNSFAHGQPLCITNCEYYTISQASSLANLRLHIVDSDMNPIKFLTPIYITVAVEPVEHDEHMVEAMSEQQENPNFITMFQAYLKKNTELMETLIAKTERGITYEPEYPPMTEIPQVNQPTELKLEPIKDNGPTNEIVGTAETTPTPITESPGEGNDDRALEKEAGTEQLQETDISEETNKVEEQSMINN